MTRWLHPPELERPRQQDQFDPIFEGDCYGLARGLSLAIWKRASEDATDTFGRRNEDQARQQFHEFAARIAARGRRMRPDVGRITRVGVELGGATAPVSVSDELRPRTPGRETLVAVEARRWTHVYGEPTVARQDVEKAKGPEKADHAMERREPPHASEVARAMAALQQPAHHDDVKPLEASSRSRLLDFVPRSDTWVPGRTTMSGALPVAVMRSTERTEVDPAAAELVARARRGGAPLDEALQSQLEAVLGISLEGIRVHTDSEADAAARALGARAFAIGDDVFFRNGAYDPQQCTGQQLIAHEIAHTVQARGTSPPSGNATMTVSEPDDASEREAEAFAAAFAKRVHLHESSEKAANSVNPRWVRLATSSHDGAAASPEITEERLSYFAPHTLQADGSRTAARVVHRQIDPEAARVAKLIADYNDAVRRLDWQVAAEHLNGFNDTDVQIRLRQLSGTEVAEMRRGAVMNPRLGGGTRLVQAIDARNPDAPRVAQLIDNYESARQRDDWQGAAEHLNGFNDTDIQIRLRQLSDVNLTAIRQGAISNPRLGGGARLARAVDVESTTRVITAAGANATAARAYLTAFQSLSPADQEARVNLLPGGFDAQATLGALFRALPAADLDGAFRDTIRRISDLLERRVVREATGQTDAQMAQVQAAFMDQQAAAAAAAANLGGPPPTAAQVQQAHQQSVAAAGIGTRTTNRWTALGPAPGAPESAAQTAFRARAQTAIAGPTGIVARAATQAPELGINAAQISFRPDLIDCAADTRYAEVSSTGGLNVGMDFIDAAMPPNGNPDYVLGVVVHEIYGHPAHGNDMTQSYTFQIFNQARSLTTQALSAADRAAPASRADMFAYGYHGTEIYAEMREHRYTVQAPSGSGIVQGDVPADDILNHVTLIKTQFAPSLARAFLRGLYARLRIDPRITRAALALFTSAVEHEFPGQHVLQ